jgi:hypothetical protein
VPHQTTHAFTAALSQQHNTPHYLLPILTVTGMHHHT